MAADRPPKHRSRRPARTHPAMPHEEKPSLGLAGSLANTFINSPLSPMLLMASLFIGLLGLVTDYIFKISGRIMFKWTQTHG